MKKRRLLILALSGILAVTPITAYAAEGWVQDERGWKYQLFDGSWRTNGWVPDENNENIIYYMDENGYMLTNCYTPDGCWVDENGAYYDENYGEVVYATAESYRGELFYPEETDYPLKGTLAYSIGFDGKPELFQNNPEYVQVNSFTYGGEPRLHDNIVLLYLAGLWDQGLTQYEVEIVNIIKEFLNSFDWKNATDYEKTDKAIRFIAKRSKYINIDGDGLDTNSSYSCLVKGISVCDGFAQSFHLLTRAVGIKSYYVGNLSHAWNYVEINGEYYEIDPSILTDIYHNQNDNFNYILNNDLTIPSDRVDQYIWILNGTQLQFDSSAPTEPIF
ncbi:hypothetical protein C0033_09080 [Clostridium sp. chh4-2]|uniref:transglutaminase domain-containing protein n=1 Tax=Clostridium sp. chh4-2 TaxID=2067550 RepID=UPI000CCDFF49|nr:transglutaminase domain-containing protein [Clostridium sp. chh4-2]PNV62253.1 hypothetical protein C0033_09080 [Clostridium sp. chh4-2]